MKKLNETKGMTPMTTSEMKSTHGGYYLLAAALAGVAIGATSFIAAGAGWICGRYGDGVGVC